MHHSWNENGNLPSYRVQYEGALSLPYPLADEALLRAAFCERGQIFSGLAKSRIWREFLSFRALIIFKPFLLLFLFFAVSTYITLLWQ